MELIATFTGLGYLRLDAGVPSEVGYKIDVWHDAAGVTYGRGRITGAVDVIFRAALARGSIPLALADNRVVDITITARGAGNDWAEIYVQDPPIDKVKNGKLPPFTRALGQLSSIITRPRERDRGFVEQVD